MTAPHPDDTNRPRYYSYGDREDRDEPSSFYATAPADTLRVPRTRRRRHGRTWLIVIIVLAALLAIADRVAVVVTQNQLASKIQQSQHLNQKPSVSIDGFPFLTQVISRHFDHVTVDINNFVSDGVPVAHIHADLRGVHVSSGYDSATVDTLTGTATLDYNAVSQALSSAISGLGHVSLSQGPGNQVKATYSVLGANLSADIAVDVLSGNTLEFKSTNVTSPLPGTGNLDWKIPLNGLPFGMRLTTPQVTSTGVDISATGTNVPLTSNTIGTGG